MGVVNLDEPVSPASAVLDLDNVAVRGLAMRPIRIDASHPTVGVLVDGTVDVLLHVSSYHSAISAASPT
jgi:hypothetical protein